ncbi:hypothetical protein [Reyranella soli]|uniref:Uncharacterized protein n=1 Tax=Reyranella soli TaxID=1230389 RepID=A0A512NSG1_9HYPH|nr:hypothetical protein [Reyranella soli]GEP61879.1 hypothetical protein RSO01_90450 [Reyranella soli]
MLSHYALPVALLLAMALSLGVAAVLVSREVVKRQAISKCRSQTAARPFRPNAFTGFDLLLIGIIALTFAALARTTIWPLSTLRA